MEKNFELKLNQEEKDLGKKIEDFIEEKEKSALEPIPGEIEKTPLEKEFIEFAEKAIQEEIDKCGSERKFSCPTELIHFLPNEIFEKEGGETEEAAGGWQGGHGGRIIMRYPENGYEFSFYRQIVHEMLHEAGHAHIIVGMDEDNIPNGLYPQKVGFSEKNFKKMHEHFKGLNELMVEKMAHQILLKSKGLERFMEGKSYDLYEVVSSFGIINRVLEGVAEKQGISEKDLWLEMERSYFSGDVKMQYVRDIENVFGKGSLRVLDCIEPYVGKEEGINAKIHVYFATDDAVRREELRKEILG